jgi:hypothetical protein
MIVVTLLGSEPEMKISFKRTGGRELPDRSLTQSVGCWWHVFLLNEQVKIDVWGLLQDELGYTKYAEVTNFFQLQYLLR